MTACFSIAGHARTDGPPREGNPTMNFKTFSIVGAVLVAMSTASLGANHKAAGRGSEPSRNPRRSRTERRRNPKPRSTPATRIYRSDQYWVWRCTCIKSAGRYTSGNAGYASRITRASRARRSEQSPSFDSARSVKSPAGQSQPLNKPVQIEGSQDP